MEYESNLPENLNDVNSLPDDLQELEESLYSLRPRKSKVNREQILLHAGRPSSQAAIAEANATPARTPRGIWPYATCLSSLVAIGFAIAFFNQPDPTPQVVEKIVYVDRFVESSRTNTQSGSTTENKNNPAQAVQTQNNNSQPAPLPESFTLNDSARMLRLRYPVLATDADLLPDSRVYGDESSPTVSHRSLRDEFLKSNTKLEEPKKQQSGWFPLTFPLLNRQSL
ncbi:MAG: hypothetical protein Tsb009_35030 [Planctomycetaceae bacterium]